MIEEIAAERGGKETVNVKELDQRIDEILVNAVDPHVHSGPSIAPRAVDHLELARQLSSARFRAAVTKDHDYSGVMTAAMVRKHHPELSTTLYSGIVLNNVVGGLNPYASNTPRRWTARSSGCRRSPPRTT